MEEKNFAFNLCRILGKIKDLKRSGWIKHQVQAPESDADHMFSSAFLALLLTPDHLNRSHCIELALCHDIQEIYSGDPTPGEKNGQQKYQEEMQAIHRLADELNFPHLITLFDELEAQKTPEAKFIRILDKVDTAITACYYDQENRSPVKMQNEFFTHAYQEIMKIDSPDKKIILEILASL